MKIQRLVATIFTGVAATAALAGVAFAQVHATVHPVSPIAHASGAPQPLPSTSLRPIALPSASISPLAAKKRLYVHAVASGTRVSLARLPDLPMRTAFNTIQPGHGRGGGHYRPMAATGATLGITAAAACATGGTIGTLFNVGCQLTVQAVNMDALSTTDHFQYYVVPPNSVTATEFGGAAAGCTPTTDPWTRTNPGPLSGPSCTGTSTLLSQAGTYAFLIYDTTSQVIVSTIYVNAGAVFTLGVYQDPYHSEPAYQFNTASSPAAYIYLTNVAPSDHYVAEVTSTGVNSYCVYMSPPGTGIPAPSPRPTGTVASLLCNPSTSAGNQAPGGNLSLEWQFNTQLEAGTYTITIYDKDANGGVGETLGSVQVSLTTANSSALLTSGSTTGMNASPGPNGPISTNVVAWDSSADQSVGGISSSTQEVIPAGSYWWTLSNPEGQVVAPELAASTPVKLTTAGTTNQTFTFSALNPQPSSPGQYASPNWVVQLYNIQNNQVQGSQSFQIVGYHSTTRFIIGGNPSVQLNYGTNAGIEVLNAGLEITNDSNTYYNGQGDSFSQLEFTSGVASAFNGFKPPSNTTGNGVTMTFTANASCNGAAGCSETVTDTNGNAWTATDYCSVATPAASTGTNSQCVITLVPVSASVTLAPGASITIPTLYWYANADNPAWPCYSTPCLVPTTELPTHGLSWSATNNLADPVAYTPISFGGIDNGLNLAVTGRFDYQGSENTGGSSRNINTTQGQTPWVNGHFYRSDFTRADYQNSTPFSPSTGRYSIGSFKIVNNGTPPTDTRTAIINGGANYPEIAIGLPTYFTPSQVTVDAQSTATWTKATCPSTFGNSYVCFNGPEIMSGQTSQIFVDMPLSVPSFSFQEFTIVAFSNDDVYITLTKDGTTENTIDGSTAVDSLGIGSYSLNGNLMGAAFTPNTVGSGQAITPITVTYTNTTTAADPNPDPVDALVLENTTNSTWTPNGTPTVTTSLGGWSYIGSNTPPGGYTGYDYWFGLTGCTQYNTANGPPQTRGITVPLTAAYNQLTACSAAQESNSLQPGQTATLNLNLNTAGGMTGPTQTFNLYAHGANGGGWTTVKSFSINVSNESASAGFSNVGPTTPVAAVATNSVPTVATSPNYFIYTLKNTSASAYLKTILITIPAYDINGAAATDGTANGYWELVSPISSTVTLPGGTGLSGSGCAVNTNSSNTYSAVPGNKNGQIEVDCTTGIPPGKTLEVQFESYNPSSQSDSYNFPSTVDGVTTGATWTGDQTVAVAFSIGLNVVVNPSNPGPGGSTPVENCTQCSFAGSTIDFGAIAQQASVPALTVTNDDLVRASVYYTGASAAHDFQLTVSTSINPACTGSVTYCPQSTELVTSVDSSTSANKCGVTMSPQTTTWTSIPVSPSTLNVGAALETNCATPYDFVQNIRVQLGTEPIQGQTATITYTLIP